MVKFWRYFCFLILNIFLAIAISNCTNEPSTPLRIGSNFWVGYETLYLARDLGYYKDAGIKLVDYPSGTEEVRAYRNQEIEGAGLSIDQALVLAASQKNIKIIVIMDISNGSDVILGTPNIKQFKDLKGKRVGVESTALGAFFLTRALEKNGMSSKDIDIVSLELSEHQKAYEEGKIDAVVTFDPPRSEILAKGANLLFDSSQIPGEIVDVLAVSDEAIANKSAQIQRLVNGHFKALEYFKKNPTEAAKIMATRSQITPEQLLNAFQGLSQPNLAENKYMLDQNTGSFITDITKLEKIMIENKLLPEKVNIAEIFDNRFVKNVSLK